MELLQLPGGRSSVRVWSLSFCCITTIALLQFFLTGGVYGITGNETDRLALLEIKARIVSDGSLGLGALTSWNTSIHFCRWSGVTCGRRHQRVTVLDLRSQLLSGTISPHIGNLSFLRMLDLRNNTFRSSIPPEVGHLSRLRVLYLTKNNLTGQIPSNLSLCSNLARLHLQYNMLEGNLPTSLFSLSKLQHLILEENHLTGPIPPSFGNLSSLIFFRAAQNKFVGRIPNEIGKLRNLEMLSLGSNNFTGSFPPSIFNISSIRHLVVSDNVKLEGSLPPDLGFILPNLQFLTIRRNRFTGPIPKSISNASNLEHFQCVDNRMSGDIPSLHKMSKLQRFAIGENQFGRGQDNDLNFLCSLANSTVLRVLQIGYNNLGGKIPACISNLSITITNLFFTQMPLSGSFPDSVGNLINLETLAVQFTNISGTIPFEIGSLISLKVLYLGFNFFSGHIPGSIGNLTKLTKLVLYDNSLEGPIPTALGMCRNLLYLSLGVNKLTGAIPSEIMNLSSLSILADFSENHLTGELPFEVGTLKSLSEFWIHKNNLSGKILSSLGDCISLESLDMQENLFQGSIPLSLSSLRGLQELNLSNNRLSGQIPEFLADLSLSYLDLAFNQLEGPLPTKGAFRNASQISIIGNNKLCGGLPEFQLPYCDTEESNKKSSSTRNLRNIIVYTISGFLGGVALLLLLMYIFWLQKERQTKKAGLSSSMNALARVSYQSILKATDGFSSRRLMGVGSFGSVYRATFDGWDFDPVAVKVLNLTHYGASKSFIAECEALRNIRHRNLVKIVTACSSTDHQGNDFKALLYEFMANGNLDEWLHPPNGTDDETPKKLDLRQRLNIIVDVACALDYLHHHCETPMVHCDLKPSNVLLNEDLTAHIGDFGLARFLPEATHKFITDQTSSIGVRGSFGYIAPEYGAGGEVSTYGDVYSFGILILEVFTGKRPTDDMFTDDLNLHNFAKAALPEHVSQIVDPILIEDDRNMARNHSPETQECLVSVIEIGVTCSSELPRERMNVSNVAAALRIIRDKSS